MKCKFLRLQLAALVAGVCAASTGLGADLQYRSYTLSWTPPTQNDDGSPLTDLAGYYVYAGSSPDNLLLSYFVGAQSPSLPLYFAAVGPEYFAVSAVNVDGFESPLSGVLCDSIE